MIKYAPKEILRRINAMNRNAWIRFRAFRTTNDRNWEGELHVWQTLETERKEQAKAYFAAHRTLRSIS